MRQRLALQIQLTLRGLRPLDLNLIGLAPGDIPEALGGLHDGQGQLLGFAVGQARPRPSSLQALAERGKPALEHRADGVGRTAADLLAHPLDRGAQALAQEDIGGFPDLRLLDAAASPDGVDVVARTFQIHGTPCPRLLLSIIRDYRKQTTIYVTHHTWHVC